MTIAQALLAFTVAAALLTVTPGLDTAMVLRVAGSEGARRAFQAALGICLGCLAWGAAVSVGLGALLVASPIAFQALKWVGAGYLLWLGVGLLLRPRHAFGGGEDDRRKRGSASPFAQGLLTNLLNPKVGLFYVTFLPQFIPQGMEAAGFSMLLAGIHSALGMIWFVALIAATVPLARLLKRPGIATTLDRLTGGVFVLFGARLALGK